MIVQSIQYGHDIYMNHYRSKIYRTYEDQRHRTYFSEEYHISPLYNNKGQLEVNKTHRIDVRV